MEIATRTKRGHSFDPRSRTGSDCGPMGNARAPHTFRSTLPHGERPVTRQPRGRNRTCFDPRSRTGSDFRLLFGKDLRDAFRSTLPHGERQIGPAKRDRPLMFRSTLPHGERPALAGGCAGAYGVSIHAPARGATPADDADLLGHGVSIHAPARGATCVRRKGRIVRRFRSTLPHGERPLTGGSGTS